MKKVEADQIFTEELYHLPGKVLVLIPTPWESIQPDHEVLLRKILASVKLSLDGVQVLHLAEADINSLNVYKPSHILSFGTRLNPECKPFTIEKHQDIQIIQSESLEILDDSKKKSLWIALKQAFGL
jgi:DNA polymerase III psi subunit